MYQNDREMEGGCWDISGEGRSSTFIIGPQTVPNFLVLLLQNLILIIMLLTLSLIGSLATFRLVIILNLIRRLKITSFNYRLLQWGVLRGAT